MVKRTLMVLSAGAVLALTATNVAFAWHPKADIIKKVQNVTSNSVLADANNDTSAVASKPGDTLKYVIEVSNVGQPNQQGYNDLHYTVLSDTLPAGVELVANPAQREIKENLGVLKPGQKVTKEYLVKVTSQTNGQIVTNEACVDGDSEVKDHIQHKCDVAKVKVTVEPKKEVLGEKVVIPATGPGALAASVASVGALGYGVTSYVRAKRNLASAHRK